MKSFFGNLILTASPLFALAGAVAAGSVLGTVGVLVGGTLALAAVLYVGLSLVR
jgi:hypothetical protein